MQRAIVVGGSGMLAAVSSGLVKERGMTVGVIARTQKSLDRLEAIPSGFAGRLVPMALDYHNVDRLRHWIGHFQLMEGPIDLVVAWIHQPVVPVLEAVISEVEAYRHMPWRLVHVVGSQAGFEAPGIVTFSSWCAYQRVILGFVLEGNSSRWLLHSEISQGVLRAIQSDQPTSVVGTLEPPDRRP